MILPVVAYGDPVLRKRCAEIDAEYPELKQIIEDMFETMYNAPGVGLAAPQIGLSIRLFIVDSKQLFKESESPEKNGNGTTNEDTGEDDDDFEEEEGIKQVFINPVILEESGDPWTFEEGCLSIPGIREDVVRDDHVLIEYYDEAFNIHEEEFTGVTARIIQHEYDHIEGVLFTDHLKPLKKQLLKSRLNAISKGNIDVAYKMLFPVKKKR